MIKPVLIAVTVASVITGTIYFSPLDKEKPAPKEKSEVSISEPRRTQEPKGKQKRMLCQPRVHKNVFSIPPGTFVVGLGMPTLLYVLMLMGRTSKTSLQTAEKRQPE